MVKVSRSFPRVFWYSVVVAVLCSSLSLAVILFLPNSHTIAIQLSGIIVSLVIGLSGRRARDHGLGSARLRLAQRWIAVVYLLAMLSPCCAVLVVLYYNVALHQVLPTPSWADFFGLLTYLFIVIYTLLLPTTRLPSDNERVRRILDDLLIMGNFILFGWYFILEPILLEIGGTTSSKITASAYPIGILVIIYCFLRMARRTTDASTRPAILLFACAILIGAICISLYGYLASQHMYTLGGILDLGLQIAYILFGLGTQALRLAPSPFAVGTMARSGAVSMQENRPLISSTFMMYLPYFLLVLTTALFIYCWHSGAIRLRDNVIYFGCAFLVTLSFLRQILILREITTYAKTTSRLNQALAEANARLEVLSTTDPLTKLLNRGALIVSLVQEIERARRYRHPLSVLFFDADNFKRVNDVYGHSVGDAVLCEVGSRVQATLREGDSVGRYGGEEFVVLLPETNLAVACDIAERLLLVIAARPLVVDQVDGGLGATLSIGVATFPTDGQTANEMLEQADQAMYLAKQSGRNQVRTTLQNKHTNRDSPLAATIE